MKLKLLDLFCGAGGASMGYHRAGFEVIGVDHKPQPHYPFEFHQADALEFPLEGFDAYHASPPCQAYSKLARVHHNAASYPDLIGVTRERLRGKLYVIENVVGAPLLNPMMLCGTMFDLHSGEYWLRRHRLFESSVSLTPPKKPCNHIGIPLSVYGCAGGSRNGVKLSNTEDWRIGMEIDWMTGKELAQSIPPAFTEFIGKQLLFVIRGIA